ncbi:MAG: DUF1624 domain-containing protein [Oscillibacter sp.]|nr:DUF1624 domain-containing protein [Oscillibacter sp.]
MMLYHAAWDLVYGFGVPWTWYGSYGAYLWQQSICWTFLLLSGYCFHLGRRRLRRGLLVSGGGLLVSAAMLLFMPENRVFWGVLSLLGAAVLLTIPLDRYFQKIPASAGAAGSFALFLLTRSVPGHTLGLGWLVERFPASRFGTASLAAALSLRLPDWLYRNDWTAVFGFPHAAFYSTDYFPLLPWLFLFWTGYFLYRLRPPAALPFARLHLPILTALGRRSLLVYLLHQPVIYGVLTLWDVLRKGGTAL